MTIHREPLRDRMRGRWHGVLPELGVPAGFLNGRHQPCPMCGGKDRARFDDKDGIGTYFCSQCGAGDGVALVMKINGWDFKTAAERIEVLIGTVEPRQAAPKADPDVQLGVMRKVWQGATSIGQSVQRYLASRGLDGSEVRDMRQAGNEMLALLRDPQGNGCQIHRTLLTPVGEKADVDQPRLFMPGSIVKGSAVRLMPHQGEVGIAEGIETALSAAILFKIPCWAALNAAMLRQWEPPAKVEYVTVFGDNDANFTGQAAAYELARRLSSKVGISVEIPKDEGKDWNDVLVERETTKCTGQ
jgi:putative DNA primase/helicase